MLPSSVSGGGEVVLYQEADGRVQLDVRLERETVWLTQAQMAKLFGRERSVITKHLRNVYSEQELDSAATCAKFAQVQTEGPRSVIRDGYNLKGDQDKQEIALSYAESLDLADKDINDNWDIYQERFLRGDYP